MLEALVSLFFPPCCLACKRVISYKNQIICIYCLSTLPLCDFEKKYEKLQLQKKLESGLQVNHILSLYRFTKQGRVQRLLHQMKYNKNKKALKRFGSYFGAVLKKKGYNREWDCIIPIPLHYNRYLKRGFNQSDLFAQGVSKIINIPIYNKLILRITPTTSQTKKDKLERYNNTKGAFVLCDNGALVGKRILLVDDLITTGSTISAAIRSLINSGLSSISVGVFAVAY